MLIIGIKIRKRIKNCTTFTDSRRVQNQNIMLRCLQRNMTELTLATFCSQLNHNNFNAISHSLQAEPPFVFLVKKKGKGTHEPKAQRDGAYPGFISMNHLVVLLLPTGQDGSPSQGYLPAVCCWYPFIHPGEERQKWSKVPCLRKQRDGRGLNPRPPDPEFEVLTTWPHTPPILYS